VRESASDTKQVYSFVEDTLAWLGTLDYIEKVAFFGAWEKVSVYHVWLLAEAFFPRTRTPGHPTSTVSSHLREPLPKSGSFGLADVFRVAVALSIARSIVFERRLGGIWRV
jgi:hypothetical protein